jgi:Bax protein
MVLLSYAILFQGFDLTQYTIKKLNIFMNRKLEIKVFPMSLLIVLIIFSVFSLKLKNDEVEKKEILPEIKEFTQLPNFNDCENTKAKLKSFVNFVTPIVAYENKKILLDRQQLLKIMKKQTLDSSDSLWLKEKTTYYKIKSTKFNDLVLAELLKRIDIIPVEVVLAQAAIESNWGTSAFATKYNNLFGTRTSSKKNGIIPKKRAKSETYRVAAYRTVNESIRSYLRNINTHKAYAEFRNNRAKLRMHNKPLDGLLLADYLTAYSTFGTEYVQRIKSLMRNHQKMFNKKIDMENL